ncbi:MAG TPA: transcription antitermination factor NusB [Thermodesulfobacteriota bacterium]|nr:transcription antitermination factor NusB [Thermodesulfobacteriota bacterium]
MGIRRRARELALQFLYQYDALTESSGEPLRPEEQLTLFWERSDSPVPEETKEFSSVLILGACKNLPHIDDIISRFSEHWRLSRMSKIDRNILRLSIYELMYLSDIPPAVTINEAVELGKRFGTEESGSFINGILDKIRIARDKGEL